MRSVKIQTELLKIILQYRFCRVVPKRFWNRPPFHQILNPAQ